MAQRDNTIKYFNVEIYGGARAPYVRLLVLRHITNVRRFHMMYFLEHKDKYDFKYFNVYAVYKVDKSSKYIRRYYHDTPVAKVDVWPT